MIESIINYNTDTKNPVNDFTEVKPSTIEGFGLFAKAFIPKGTIWWAAAPEDVMLLNREQYITLVNSQQNSLSKSLQHTLLVYSYYIEIYDVLVFCLDNARFVNHSFNPNSGGDPISQSLASMTLRDIYPGEEILEDYTKYDQCPWASLCETFLCRDNGEMQK